MRYEDNSGSVSGSATPEARDDADTLATGSNGPATGNVITGAGTTTGKAGADAPANGHVVAVRGASGTDSSDSGNSLHVDGRFGTLAIDEHGNYKYVADGHAPQNFRDLFQYTLADSKGGRSVADLVISRGGEIQVSENAQKIVPNPDGTVTLPAGVDLNDVHVVGRDLVVTMPDGSQIVIVDGAVFVPQLVLGGVEVPSTNLAALLIDAEPKPAAGNPQSSGGNFDVPVPPLDPGVPLGDLIPPTELHFTPPEFQPIYPGQIDHEPTIEIQPDGQPASVNAEDSVDEKGLPARNGGEPAGSGEIADGNGGNNSDASETTAGTIIITSEDGIAGVTINGVAVTGVPGQVIAGDFGTLTITGFSGDNILYSYTLADNTSGNNTHDDFSVTITDPDGDQATATLVIDIIDDVPTARPDTDSVAAGTYGPETGNVLTGAGTTSGAAGADTVGADDAHISNVTGAGSTQAGEGSWVVNGQYGVLTINDDGSYSYTRNPGTPGGVSDVFNYTLTDGDGDTSTTTLTINIGDSTPHTGENPVVRLDDDALANGNPGGVGDDDPDTANLTGNLAGGGGDGPLAFAVQTTGAPSGFSYVSGGAGVVLVQQGGHTVLTVTVGSDGSYSVVQNAPIDHAVGDNENNSIFTINYTVTDQDNDSAPGSFTINVDDDTPVVGLADRGTPQLVVDETDLSVNATASFASNFSVHYGADGPAASNPLVYSLGVSAPGADSGLVDVATGQAVVLVMNGGVVEGHVGTAAGALAFTVSVDSSGNVTLDQIRALTHPDASNPDDAVTLGSSNLVTLTATATDHDGDSTAHSLNIGQSLVFEDDGPSINSDGAQPTLTVDETVLSTDATASFAGVFSSSFGADGAGTVTYALGTSGGASGLTDTLTGQAIVLVDNAGVIEGHVGNAAGALAFTVSVDGSGNVTLDQIRSVVHADPTNPDDATSLSGDSLVTLTATVTDRDGDQASATANIGQNLVFEDDGPSITTSGSEASLTVDETNLAINATASFAGAFTPVFGNDGPGSPGVTYALSINAGATGLVDVATGQAIVLVNNAGVIEGHVGNAAGAVAFTVSVAANGDVTLDQVRALAHPDASNPDDSVSLANDNLIVLTATAHDGDGDTANAALNIGQNLNFEDDGPSINANGTQPSLTVDETVLATNATASFAGVFNSSFGADGAGTLSYALGISAPGANSGLIDVATGSAIVLVNNAGVIEGHVGTTGGALAFTVSVDASGNVTLDQIRALSHPDASNPDDSVTLSSDSLVTLTATITDRDGDHQSATANIGQNLNFEDDGPSISLSGTQANLTVDETVLATNDTQSFAGAFSHSFGADGAGTVTYSLSVLSAGVNSGLVDTATGSAIVLVNNAGVIEGHVGTAAGALAFTVTVDGSGNVTLDQIRAVVHPNMANPDDSVTLSADNLVQLTATVTDRDGDHQSATLNIGQNLNFEDDGPSANNDSDTITSGGTVAQGNVISGVGTNEGAANADAPGADGFGSVTTIHSNGSGLTDTTFSAGLLSVHGTYGTLEIDANGNYTYTRDGGSPGNVSEQFTYTYVDKDGDPATATLTINISDSAPTLPDPAPVLLDDDALANGNPGGPGGTDDVDSQGTPGQLVGSGGDGTLTYSFSGTNTLPSGFTTNLVDASHLQVLQGATVVLTITLNTSTGVFSVVQNNPIDHPAGNLENNDLFGVGVQVKDVDGDTDGATITINVDDDTPTVVLSGTSPSLTVDETVLATNDTKAFAGMFTDSFGADGPAAANSVAYALGINAGATGLVDVATGQAIVLVNNAGIIEGHVGNAGGALAFTVSVDGSGNVTLDQMRALSHPDASNPNDSVTLANDNLITLTQTITDHDGDQASATANIGQNLNFLDDGPSITLSGSENSLTVDETNLAANDTKAFAGAFTPVFGADGAGTVTYALSVTGGNGTASGLIDVATGSAIVLVNNAGVIEGHVGTTGGALAFTVTVDGSGNVTLDQIRAVQHPDASNPNDSVTLSADNLVVLTATVTDKDGDHSSVGLNIGQNLNFLDDGPSISTTGAEPNLTVDETNLAANDSKSFAANFSSSFGADGAGTVTYQLGVTGGNGTASGLVDVATGQSIVLVNNAGVIEGHVGTTGGALAFTVTVDGSGNVTLDQIRAVSHPDASNPNDSVTLSADNLITLTATVTDKDGDHQSASLNIGQNLSFLDDGPSAHIATTGAGVSLDESVGIQADSNDTTAAGVIALFSGVANKGVDTDLPQYATNANAVVNSTGTTLGADGGTIGFSLNVSSAGVDSGLNTTDGQDIFLFKEGNLIVGRVGGAGGQAAFAIAIDNSGHVSTVEYLSIQHPNAANPDDSVSIANGAVLAVVTATDGDGDTSSQSVGIGGAISFQDSAPVLTAVDNINIQNTGDIAATGGFHYLLGADGASTDNNVFSLVTGSATVNGNAVTNYTISETSENATSAVYTFSFDYNTGAGATAHETGTLTFDKSAGTYTVDLADPIAGFSVLATAGAPASAFINYNTDGSTSQGPSNIATVQLANNFFMQFTGDSAGSHTTVAPDGTFVPVTTANFAGIETFTGSAATVTVSSSAAGVAGNTIQGGEVLDFNLYATDPHGTTGGAPTTSATSMFIELDGVGVAEDMIVVLKLYDTVTHQYTTEALMVQNGDIIKSNATLAGTAYAGIVLDNNDGLIVIEANDYQQGNSNLVIVGAQIAGSDSGVTGTAINLNGGLGASGGSSGTQAFSTDVNDNPFKIQNIGFLTNTTTNQNADLTFNVTIKDGDGDSLTQVLHATVTSSADSATPISLGAGVTTVSQTAIAPKTVTTTNSNSVLMGAFAAAGLAASDSLAAATPHTDLHSSVSHMATVAYHSQSLAPVAIEGLDGHRTASMLVRDAGEGSAHVAAQSTAFHNTDMVAAKGVAAANTGHDPSSQLLHGTSAPVHAEPAASQMTAASIAMPAASQLAAAHGGAVAGQHNGALGQVLAEALHGGGNSSTIDHVLSSLPSHAGGGNPALEALASHNAMGVPMGDSHAFAGFTAGHAAFSMEAVMVHVDAVQTHA